jgi:hypothetical protein
MEQRRNWLGWIAVVLAGMALLVALGGRFDRGERAFFERGGPVVQAPSFDDNAFERRGSPFAHEGFGPGRHGFGPGQRDFGHGGFSPFGLIFSLLGGLTKLLAFGLLAWLLLTIFQQRRQQPPAPTTPAGHDPRVE